MSDMAIRLAGVDECYGDISTVGPKRLKWFFSSPVGSRDDLPHRRDSRSSCRVAVAHLRLSQVPVEPAQGASVSIAARCRRHLQLPSMPQPSDDRTQGSRRGIEQKGRVPLSVGR